ncbi:NAD(P)-binding protein [Novosphingobium sp.]|uniref:NAD(P)-binding protein n=1 Tax=Novosphingobium sp. TaxID=1874826 RepID=UPI0038BDAF08
MSKDGANGIGVTRRDFVRNTAAGSTAAALAGTPLVAAAATSATPAPSSPSPMAGEPGGYYPPVRTGMRGSHPGSFEVAHALRNGQVVGQALAGPAHEDYDLVVVGGGISGLSAALFYRDRNPSARILILENHDDFGGHAKRNEFHVRGHTLIANGGTLGIDSPTPYSTVADGLLRRIGIDVPTLSEKYGEAKPGALDKAGLQAATFFDRETFGRDALVKTPRGQSYAEALKSAPLSAAALAQIAAFEAATSDPLGTMPMEQRKDYLSRISYRAYLQKHGGLGDEAVALYQNRPLGWWCVGADGISALDAWGTGFFPGFKAVKLDKGGTFRMGYTPRGFANTGGSYAFHFPDGNGSVARLLVAQLIPAFMGGGVTAESAILAPCHYETLDREGQPVRLRLSSTVVRVENRASAGADVVYSKGGQVRKVAARHVVMACWNMIIPHLIPTLGDAQKAALHELVKEPLVYVSVALDNWRAFAKAGVGQVTCPTNWYQSFGLDRATEIGGYTGPASPDDPILMRLSHIPHAPGLPEHDQSRAGRAELLGTDLATFESHIADLLTRAMGAYGFDAGKDIVGVTVNRWPHGYAPEYNALWDAKRDDEPDAPHLVGRKRFGAIAIANSDSGRAAYTDSAIDQAYRAVNELMA